MAYFRVGGVGLGVAREFPKIRGPSINQNSRVLIIRTLRKWILNLETSPHCGADYQNPRACFDLCPTVTRIKGDPVELAIICPVSGSMI